MSQYQVCNCAIGSTQVSGADPDAGQNRTVHLIELNPKPEIVWIQYGAVDMLNGVDQTTFGTAYQSMLTSIRAGLPGVLVICEAGTGQNDTDTGNVPYNATIASVVATLNDQFIVYSHRVVDLYKPLSTYNWHPNATGAPVMAGIVISEFAPDLSRGSPTLLCTG